MTNGKTYTKQLVNGKVVTFTVKNRIGLAEVEENEGCDSPSCTHCGPMTDHIKLEAAYTDKTGTLLLRRLNYTKNREESHQVFESVAHLIANLDKSKPADALLLQQLSGTTQGTSSAPEAI